MFRILATIVAMVIAGGTFAQVNVLPAISLPEPLAQAQPLEDVANYYLLTIKEGPKVPGYPLPPVRLTLFKINKNSNMIIDSAIAFGDTQQIDSVINGIAIFPLIDSGRIHIAFTSLNRIDTSLGNRKQIIKIFSCDTSLNQRDITVVPTEARNALQNFTKGYNGSFVVSYFVYDPQAGPPGYFSKYQIVRNGAVVKSDTIGLSPIPYPPFTPLSHMVGEVERINNHQFVVTGRQLYGLSQNNGYNALYLADSQMNLIDTFNFCGYSYQDPITSYMPRLANLKVLPTNSVIAAGPISYQSSSFTHTVLAKHKQANRFAQVNQLVVVGKDNLDLHDGVAPSIHNLEYNSFDNLIYYVNYTNSNSWLSDCSSPGNFIQIVCADTNLNLKWRKFIPAGVGLCAQTASVTACVNRPGVLVTGQRTSFINPADTTQQSKFIYYVDSSGVGLGISDTSLHHLREQVTISPNPVRNTLDIRDLLGTMRRVVILDLYGRSIVTVEFPFGQEAIRVDLAKLLPGAYVAKILTSDHRYISMSFSKL